MTTFHDLSGDANIDRLNAFLDQFAGGCDPDFDDTAEVLERQFAEIRFAHNHH